jgi:hypothetical protein
MVAYDATPGVQFHAPPHSDPHRLRTLRWKAASAEMGALLASDPEAAARYAPVGAASMALLQSRAEPTERARALLEAWRGYYAWVHSRMGDYADVINGEVLARSMLRSSLLGVQAMLGVGVVARIRQELLGDTVTSQCKSCGGALASEAVTRCTHCGALAHVETDDPWVAGVLTLWGPNEERLVREKKLDTFEAPMTVIQLVLAPVYTGTGKVTPEALHRMLVRLVPWAQKSRVVEAISLLQGAAVPAAREVLARTRHLVDASWIADASKKPAPKH